MISRSARDALSRGGGLGGRTVVVAALGAALCSLLLELCLLSRERRDLRRTSFGRGAPDMRRSRRHGHLVLGSHPAPFDRSRSAAPRQGFGDAFSGSCHGSLEVSPSASSFRFTFVVGGVVVVELEPSLPGNAAKKPDVCVGHDRPDPAPSRTTLAADAASSCVAYGLDCARLSPSLPTIDQQWSPPLSSNTRNEIAAESGRAAALRERGFFTAAVIADAFLLFWLERRPGSEKSWAL
jgi:hypothetical protein